MKVQLVKSGNQFNWYNNLNFPIKFNIKHSTIDGMYTILDGDKKGYLLAILDCINDEDYIKIDNVKYDLPDGKELNLKEYRSYDTGAKRDSDKNKPYTHNLQGYTRLRFGYLTRMGAENYGDDNFLKGFPKKESLKSLDRHLSRYMNGDKSEDHLAAIIFNVQLIMLEEQKEGIKEDHYFKLKDKE